MYKPSHKQKRRNAESEWLLDPNTQNYYRYYVDANGNTQYVWYDGDEAESSHADIPRDPQAASMAEITEGIGNLSHDAYETQPPEDEYTVTSGSKSKSKSSKSKGKGKHVDYHQGDVHPEAYPETGDYYPQDAQAVDDQDTTQAYGATQSYQQAPLSSQNDADPAYSFSGTAADGQAYSSEYDQEDPEVQAAMAESSRYNDGYYATAGQSSTQEASYESYDYGDEGPPTPKAHEGGGMETVIEEMEECGELDPRYRVQPSSMFQPGAIFKVYWAEPEGSSKDHREAAVSTQHEFQNKFGTKFYFGFRRFVVVANDLGHSTCVPVLTYGGKACRKRGVKPEKHGIIHERNHKARLVDKEPKLGFRPVRVDITEEGEKLAKESRVNYSKLVTVEHNVRVFFIGNIYYPDFDIVSEAVNSCWAAKVHHKKKHRR